LLAQLGLSKEEVVNFLGAELSMPTTDLSTLSLTPEVLGLLPAEHARFYEAIPLGTDGSSIDIVWGIRSIRIPLTTFPTCWGNR
jgi:hypothetical protein